MPWIQVLGDDEVDGGLERLYRSSSSDGEVDNVLRIHSLHPASLRAHLLLYKTLMYGPGPLSRVQREMIAVTVSAANDCHY